MEYKVAKISNNLKHYPECIVDSKEFPHLVDKVEDEMDLFIVAEDGSWWYADDFFNMVSIDKFKVI